VTPRLYSKKKISKIEIPSFPASLSENSTGFPFLSKKMSFLFNFGGTYFGGWSFFFFSFGGF